MTEDMAPPPFALSLSKGVAKARGTAPGFDRLSPNGKRSRNKHDSSRGRHAGAAIANATACATSMPSIAAE